MDPNQIVETANANAEKAHAALSLIDPGSVTAKVLTPLAKAVESNADLIARIAAGLPGFVAPDVPLDTAPPEGEPDVPRADEPAPEVTSNDPDAANPGHVAEPTT